MRALRRFLLLPSLRGGAAAALLVCLVGVAVTPRLHAQTVNVCRPNPSPANPSDPSMIVATPIAGARVTSPLTVTGQARVFEAVVSAALYDREGRLLEERHFMAAAGAPRRRACAPPRWHARSRTSPRGRRRRRSPCPIGRRPSRS